MVKLEIDIEEEFIIQLLKKALKKDVKFNDVLEFAIIEYLERND